MIKGFDLAREGAGGFKRLVEAIDCVPVLGIEGGFGMLKLLALR